MNTGNWMEDVVMPDSDGVARRLAELGLTVEILVEAIRRGQIARSFTTKSHPVCYPGAVAWGETNGALRETLGQRGWELRDEDNIPIVVSPDKIAITAISGNEHTGQRHLDAQTRRPRRAAGQRIVRQNAQLELLPDDASVRADAQGITRSEPTWFLLYDRTADTVRSELSLAGAVVNGNLLKWTERLVLPEFDMLDGPPPAGDDLGDTDLDVPVTRRVG